MLIGMERLDPVEARVLGCLVEKQLTTPQQYPLSLNAVTLACNQTSSRDPIMNVGEGEAREALDRLKQHGLVRFVLPSHGRSVVRYRHVLDERLALDDRRASLFALLLLRGPQTAAELRSRAERMAAFDSLAAVEADLAAMAGRADALVRRLERRPGQKEERWQEIISAGAPPAGADSGPLPTAAEAVERAAPPSRDSSLEALREQL
jgi:uncharacterized protein YceH (UPF0502 family)